MSLKGLFVAAERAGFSRRSVLMLLGLHIGGTTVEALGVFSLLPVLQFMQNNGDVTKLIADHWHWRILHDTYAAIGLPLRFEMLLLTSFTFLILRQAFIYVRLRYLAKVQQTAIARLCLELFQAFLGARIEEQERDSDGAILNDMTTDLNRAVQYVFALISIYGLVILFTIYTLALLLLSPTMTAFALMIFGLAFVLLRSQSQKATMLGRQVTEANQGLSSFLVERLRQVRLIRLAGIERAEIDGMNQLVQRQRNAMMRISYLLATIEIIVEPIVVGAGFIFLFVAISVVGQPLANVAVYLIVLLRLMPVVKESMRMRQSIASLAPSLDAVLGRLSDLKSAQEKASGEVQFQRLMSAIRLEKVSFRYPSASSSALDNIDLIIPARKITALVGPSGAGKSTLVDLLPRLRTPSTGEILFDGIPHIAFDIVSLRAGITFAPQAPEMFNVSVVEHIRYGKGSATDGEVRDAARLAHADEFIQALPSGYDTKIGEHGSCLSGGQRQRLDLARAIVRGAPILILDEPTSNLDAESEAKFLVALQTIRAETAATVVIIAHRLSTIMNADQIVVMEAGRILSVGTHADLVKQDTWYRFAFESQKMQGEGSLMTIGAA